MSRLNELSVSQARRLLDQKEIGAQELVQACLDRIRERDHVIGAWEHLEGKQALEAARRCDAGEARGILRGIPVGVKDNFDTFDMPTQYGSVIYRNHRPSADAACVALLREADAIILGKTVTSEFAAYSRGRTLNPYDPSRTSGISSMGSAAAVADRMVPMALGSQTSGSIIRPASFCGAIGYKPTFGFFNRSGLKPLAESLDTVGFFARSIEDVALLAGVLAGGSELRLRALDAAPKIGVVRHSSWTTVTPEAAHALEQAQEAWRSAGAEIVDAEVPTATAGLDEAQGKILQYEAARAFTFEYNKHHDALSENFREMLRRGREISHREYSSALQLARKCRKLFSTLFSRTDILLTLSAECQAPLAHNPVGDPIFNRQWTILGFPCLNLPFLDARMQLPIGLLLVGRPGCDAELLNFAHWCADILATKFPECLDTPRAFGHKAS